MDIGHKNPAMLFFRKRIGLVNPCTPVSRPVTMIHDGLNILVHIWIDMLSSLTMVKTTMENLKQVRNHTSSDKKLPTSIIIDAPRVAKAMSHNFKSFMIWMVPPYPAIEIGPFVFHDILREFITRSIEPGVVIRFSDIGRSSESFQPVQPPVGTPMQAIDRLMSITDSPTGKQYLDIFLICLVILDRDKEQVGWSPYIQSAVPYCDR